MLSQLLAVTRYEFSMQVRKKSLWLSMLLVAGFLAIDNSGTRFPQGDAPAHQVMAGWAVLFWIFLPLAAGMVLADRMVRDRRLGTTSLLESLPAGDGVFITGKYLGGVAATALPPLLLMVIAGGYEAVNRGTPAMLGWAVVAWALGMVPGLLFIAGFAYACPLVLTAPLFRVLFVGYWFWGNLLNPDFMPSLTGTLLTPVGDYPMSWLLGETALYAGGSGWLEFLRPDVSGTTVVLSIAVLVIGGVVPLVVTSVLRSYSRRRA